MPWFPQPAPAILQEVEGFKQARFRDSTVGIHIRRTDNRNAILRSPDRSYFRHGDRLLDAGYQLFLATDNQETLELFTRRYGVS